MNLMRRDLEKRFGRMEGEINAAASAQRLVLRAIAMRLPDVEPGVACKGTALESITYQVRNKAFLFVGRSGSDHHSLIRSISAAAFTREISLPPAPSPWDGDSQKKGSLLPCARARGRESSL